MSKKNQFDEFDFLALFYKKMISDGEKHNFVRLSVNARMVESIYDELSISVTEDQLQTVANICTANNWIETVSIGDGKYNNLQLTSSGVGVAKSKQMQKDLLHNQSFIKKISDFIVEHNGLFILISTIFALITLFIIYD